MTYQPINRTHAIIIRIIIRIKRMMEEEAEEEEEEEYRL